MARIAGSIAFLLAFTMLGCGDKPAGLDELSPADRKLAEAQGTCPVSGKPLGSMGKPVRMEHGDTVVFLCCGGCRKAFEADPGKYVAKLKK